MKKKLLKIILFAFVFQIFLVLTSCSSFSPNELKKEETYTTKYIYNESSDETRVLFKYYSIKSDNMNKTKNIIFIIKVKTTSGTTTEQFVLDRTIWPNQKLKFDELSFDIKGNVLSATIEDVVVEYGNGWTTYWAWIVATIVLLIVAFIVFYIFDEDPDAPGYVVEVGGVVGLVLYFVYSFTVGWSFIPIVVIGVGVVIGIIMCLILDGF
ncbi:MAG: hypothetical protein IKP77_03140 [Acholeplasmatales bacterium]|nr:hypothetical protein [Acholeplasmatales bacterium]